MYILIWILLIIIAATALYYLRKRKVVRLASTKRNPTYDEMLEMDEKNFQQWLLIRDETDREKLLAEMIDHEERTGSFRKTAKGKISGAEETILDVFDAEKSARMVKVFGKVKKVLKGEKEDVDLVEDAIFAKAASDHVGLGEKIERERNSRGQ